MASDSFNVWENNAASWSELYWCWVHALAAGVDVFLIDLRGYIAIRLWAVVTWTSSSVWVDMEEDNDLSSVHEGADDCCFVGLRWWDEQSRYLSVCMGLLCIGLCGKLYVGLYGVDVLVELV